MTLVLFAEPDADLFIRSEIFDGVSRNQPCKPGEEGGNDPFDDDEHGILLLPQMRLYLSEYMTGILEKVTRWSLQKKRLSADNSRFAPAVSHV